MKRGDFLLPTNQPKAIAGRAEDFAARIRCPSGF
jgi:hypothetical protein